MRCRFSGSAVAEEAACRSCFPASSRKAQATKPSRGSRPGRTWRSRPQELEQAVGSTEIEQIAQQAGASPEETKEVLAQALPQVVDKVTPNGQIPDQAQLDDMLGQLFGQK
jgi:YidB-like protein/Bacterial protein of unknown function (DUF937)